MTAAVLLSALVLGFFGSAHCVAMCGGVVGLFSPVGRQRSFVAAYHAGRIASYTVAGLIVGGMSSAAIASVPTVSAQYALRFVAGAVIVVVGLSTAGILRWPARWRGLGVRVGSAFRRLASPWIPVRTPAHALALGMVWGWMPCGLLYSALGIALASGSAVTGALAMLVFGAATSPALVAVAAAAKWASRPMRSPGFRAAAGLLVALSGALNVVMVSEHAGWLPRVPDATATPAHCHTR